VRMTGRKVAVVVGSETDLGLGEEAATTLRDFGVAAEIRVISAHRNPRTLDEYVMSSDAEVFLAIAGLSAALPGAIAARTTKPVIGVPRSVKLGGLDSLLSMVQMPTGVPVACVGIDSAKNAALLAVEILAVGDRELSEKLEAYRSRLQGSQC
jgi:5-(carboxyamino)imidazole ribonucleotide mutase